MSASFQHRRELVCSPAAAWRLLTDPDQMNRWSTAPITLSGNGIGDRPDGVGALRTVTLPRRGGRLREVVEEAVFPHRFVYRVYDGGPLLLDHLGEQTIAETATGCRITWTVELRLAGGVSGVVARSIGRQVGASLDRLERLADSAVLDAAAGPPRDRPAHPDRAELAALRRAALVPLSEQTAIADALAAADDPKQWFARVYQYVTQEMIAVADRPGALRNPDWVLALIPVFHEYFTRNLTAYRRGEPCTAAWTRAWSQCEREDPDHPERPVMRGLLAGVGAHIDDDLPHALLEVHRARYGDRDLREFLPDYLRLAPVFTAASDRLIADLPRSHKPWWTPIATRIHPQVRDEFLGRKGFHVGRQRMKAFARALEATRTEHLAGRAESLAGRAESLAGRAESRPP
ncbi:MxaD family protein [Gordonia iterans]|uniref:MxaD family protein n=1 Tax=Gordonia iterans TaxID=1004901 RepID=A0A2S0KDY7_9ACTN|nr:DUF5995 family protein [Gordonia iterans]AVL99863.1 MxaD family protein [Gordonia iterans]